MTLFENSNTPIGGYFELELPKRRSLPYPESMRFQSARASFLALLRARKPKKVWMPKYICNAMLAPLKDAKVKCAWYELDDNLSVATDTNIGHDDLLLYVNYFGICNKNVNALLQRFSPNQIILDYSQAFFDTPINTAFATIYSPRKFFGIPDGGLLISQTPVSSPKKQDTGSFQRVSHQIIRLGDSPETGYELYQRAEESLSECEPKKMSKLTEQILTSIDFDRIRKKRIENFLYLDEILDKHNQFSVDLSHLTAPLCYPFLTSDTGLRNRLANNRIFIPTYWPEAFNRVSREWADKMINNLVSLPIDQRYGQNEMKRLASIILGESK